MSNLLDVMDAMLDGTPPPKKVTLSGCPGGEFDVVAIDRRTGKHWPIDSPEAAQIFKHGTVIEAIVGDG